jgi:hypothetical protein
VQLVVGSEDATVMSTVQVVEVRVMRAAKVAHLLAAGIQGANLAVHVGVHPAAKGSEFGDIREAAVPLPVRGGPVGCFGADTDQSARMASSVAPQEPRHVSGLQHAADHAQKNFSATPLNAWR